MIAGSEGLMRRRHLMHLPSAVFMGGRDKPGHDGLNFSASRPPPPPELHSPTVTDFDHQFDHVQH
jgi:hypothetical protein